MAKKKVFTIGNALAAGLEETIASAHHYAGELRIEAISIKRIESDPQNPRELMINFDDILHGISPQDPQYSRKIVELESLQSLAKSIQSQGIINPIVVYKFGEKYRLIAGERRTLASLLAKKTDIQAKILDQKPDELKISLLQWVENIERSDLTLWERLKNLEKITQIYSAKKGLPSHQITVTELSQLIGCSKPHAMNYKAALIADEQLKTLMMNNKIKNLEKAAFLSNITNAQIKNEAIEACLAGATLKQLKSFTDQYVTKKLIVKVKEKRGRQATVIHFGRTKNLSVARFILDSLLNHSTLSAIAKQSFQVDWNDHRSVTNVFQQIIKKLEQIHD